jgi:hypothetical protein
MLLKPTHVSQDFDYLNTMFTLGIVAHLDRETFDNALFFTFIYDIVGLDKGSTYGSRDTNAFGSGGGSS